MGEGLRPLGHSSSLLSVMLCLSSSHCQSAQSASKHRKLRKTSNDANLHRAAPCFGRRRPAAPQRHQASSTCPARSSPATVRNAGRRGQLRIRTRTTPASSSRISSIGRARDARPTPRDADRHSPTLAGRRAGLGAARGRGPRHRDGAAAARARPCLNRPLLAAAARASRVAMPAQALKDGEEAAEEIFNQDESVRSLDPRKNRRL